MKMNSYEEGSSTMKQVLQFLKEAQTFYVATMDGDRPRVRPFGAICEFEGKLYISTGNQKKVFAQLQKNPKVEICAMVNGKWIRVEAEAISDPRREARAAMLAEYDGVLTRMYSVDDGIFEVLYLQNATATIASFTEAPVEIKF